MLISPALLLMLGAAPVPLLRGMLRTAWLLALPLAGLVLLWSLPEQGPTVPMFGMELQPTRVDPLGRVFATIFHIAAFLCMIYSLHTKDALQQAAALVYAGSAVGGALAGDLITLFVNWEIAGVSSVFMIFAGRNERAFAAGMRYLYAQIVSGLLLLAGIVLHVQSGHGIAFNHIGADSAAGLLMLVGIGLKCAFPILHAWVQDTYPEATVVGTVVLSAFTTKLAVYSLARGFAGTEFLIWVGVVMACTPIFYAVIENDLRRVLAYSMINQIGFMVVGVGIGGALGINGAAAHAFADILFKGLLFMSMGAVLFRTGTINGSDLGGLFKSMPQTTALCIVGAASISAFPLFSGFATKSLIMEAVAHEHQQIIWLLLLFASAGVFHHAGIKIPYFAFFAHDGGHRVEEAPLNMRIAMAIAAAFCIGIGCAPHLLYALLPEAMDYEPYTTAHVVNQLQLLLFSAMAFTVLMRYRIYPPELRSVNLDADWFYRRLGPAMIGGLRGMLSTVLAAADAATSIAVQRCGLAIARMQARTGGIVGSQATGSIAWWVTATLAILLLSSAIF